MFSTKIRNIYERFTKKTDVFLGKTGNEKYELT